jgi:hypothetical protein
MSQNWNPGQPPGPPGAPPGGYGGPPPGGGGPPGGYGPPGGGPPGGFGGPPPGGYGVPPPGGYGVPPGYGAPPGFGPAPAPPVPGNLALGFCAGFFGGCIGLILVYVIAKGPATKKGAGIGFAAQVVIGALLRIANA